MIATGGVFYWKKVSYEPWKIMLFSFLANIALHIPSLYIVQNRYGLDYPAYINQAGSFATGETHLNRISSLQGPCFYPAGHLWLYSMPYILHLNTLEAEFIMKFLTFIVHSLNNLLISLISFEYFKDKPEKAQMICVMLLANEGERIMNQLMFNDQILGMSIFAAIYLVTC